MWFRMPFFPAIYRSIAYAESLRERFLAHTEAGPKILDLLGEGGRWLHKNSVTYATRPSSATVAAPNFSGME